jgi:hypothetical protein
LGKFNDAVVVGKQLLKTLPTKDVAGGERTEQQSSAGRQLRKAWIDTVLNPVIADVNADVKAQGLKFVVNAKEDDYSIFVEILVYGLEAQPINLTITVGNDGKVNIYVLSGIGEHIGTVGTTDRALLEDRLVRFLERPTRTR